MTIEISTENQRDELLWRAAKRRVNFRHHLITYIIMNGFFWAVWFVFGGFKFGGGYPWPVWASLGWGIGLALDYVHSYIVPLEGRDKHYQFEKEYQKLKEQNKSNNIKK